MSRIAKEQAPERAATTVEQAGKPPEGVESFDVGPGGQHTSATIDYEQDYSPDPTVGGLSEGLCAVSRSRAST